MIIHRIRASNILKYETLSIDLADRGLIAISGANESGKSSIGETICFALFGRTFSIGQDELEKVVHWGENECSVELEFSVEGERYGLSRSLDRDGKHSVKLNRVDDEENPISRGVQAVADQLFAILGFEYEEFVESFYLAQREITTPHPHSRAVKLMAGVAPLETVGEALRSEIAEREEMIGELAAEWDAVDADVKALNIRDGRLPGLEDHRRHTLTRLEKVKEITEAIDAGLSQYTGNAEEIHRLQRSTRRTTALRLLVLLLALFFGGLWALLTFGADLSQTETLNELLADSMPEWHEDRTPFIGYLGAGLGVLFLLLWIRVAGLQGRVRRLAGESQRLAEALAQAREIDADTIDADDSHDLVASGNSAEPAGLPGRPEHDEFEMVRKLLQQGEATPRLASEYCEREVGWLNQFAGRLGEQIAGLDEEIEDEQTRLQEAMNLSDVLNGLTDKREEIEERIGDRRRGLELLEGAIKQLSNRFNRDIKELVGRMLPLFTDGRYEHLQISEGLGIRVFSNDKRDFMDLEEVSSGTQRQIMLALRLALSKKLLGRAVKGRQFVFLDEPFAFFDRRRTCAALQALTDLGDDITQIWIVAQDFPEECDVSFDTVIHCDLESNSLLVTT